MDTIRKAVTFRASSIGDCLMGKYLLENIHAQFPEARCAIVVASRGGMIRDLFAAYPWLEVREVNRFNVRELWRLWRDFRGSDIVVTQYAGKPGGRFSLRSKLFARLLARRGALAGFVDAARWNRFIYDTLVPFDIAVAPAEHERRALSRIGLSVPLPYPRLAYRKENDELVLRQFGLASGAYLVEHLFAGNASRDLSPEKRRELVRALHDG
ncbi:MAG TPA: hypothetical protein VF803_03730, partial [Candidatus Paceibacterota bacterium]